MAPEETRAVSWLAGDPELADEGSGNVADAGCPAIEFGPSLVRKIREVKYG